MARRGSRLSLSSIALRSTWVFLSRKRHLPKATFWTLSETYSAEAQICFDSICSLSAI
jgi:hypothetical protein